MYPANLARDTSQHVIKAGWKVAWQKAGKTLPVFSFVNEHNNTNTEAQATKQRLLKVTQGEKLQLVEEKDASAFKIVNHSFSGLRIKFVLL